MNRDSRTAGSGSSWSIHARLRGPLRPGGLAPGRARSWARPDRAGPAPLDRRGAGAARRDGRPERRAAGHRPARDDGLCANPKHIADPAGRGDRGRQGAPSRPGQALRPAGRPVAASSTSRARPTQSGPTHCSGRGFRASASTPRSGACIRGSVGASSGTRGGQQGPVRAGAGAERDARRAARPRPSSATHSAARSTSSRRHRPSRAATSV